jgi:hypothetical protein
MINMEAGGDVTDNEWHFFAVRVDSTSEEAMFYLDGSVRDQSTDFGAVETDNGPEVMVGAEEGSSRFFNGAIDDIAIYAEVLDNGTIDDIYAATAH